MSPTQDEPSPLLLAEKPMSWRLHIVVITAYGALFFGFFELGASFTWVYEGSLWYPAAGLRWALLLAFGRRFLPGIVVVEVLAIALYGFLHPATHYYHSWWVLMVAVTPVLYGGATAYFVHLVSLDARLRRIRDVAWFCAGTLLVTLVVVMAGRLVFFASGLVGSEDLLPTAVSFWIGDTIGILMVTPLLLLLYRHVDHVLLPAGTFARPIRDVVASLPWARAAIDFATVWASVFVLQYVPRWLGPVDEHLYWYLLFLPLIWISFRRGFAGSAIATFAFASGAAWFIRPRVTSWRLFDLQILVIFLCLTTLLMGAAVSSRRAAERGLRLHNRELREVKAQLEIRNRELESRRRELSGFLRSISHDLKNPLVTIGGFVGRLEKGLADVATPAVQSDLDAIRRATQSLNQLLNGFVEFSRAAQTLDRRPKLDLAEIARRAVRRLAPRIAAAGVRVEIAADFPAATGDRDLVFDVFLNLVENAVKFLGEQPHPRVEIGWRRKDGEEVIYVRDNGRGIDRRYHDKVFELFEKLDREGEGSGVGLTVVQRIVEEHGGRVWVESQGQGSGTTICFTLGQEPAAEPPEVDRRRDL